jgi:hypothetical protein
MRFYYPLKAEVDEIINYLTNNKLPRHACINKSARFIFVRRCRTFNIHDGMLFYKKNKILLEVVANDDVERKTSVMIEIHEKGHFGRDRMFSYISEKYYGITKLDIEDFCKSCLSCKMHEPLKRTDPLKPIETEFVRQRYQVDLVDLSKFADMNDGYNYLMNAIDCFSKYGFSIPLKTKTASEVVTNLEQIFREYGAPLMLHTDNGKEFSNHLMKTLCGQYSVEIVHGRARHPQSQGQIERFNQTVTRYTQSFEMSQYHMRKKMAGSTSGHSRLL